VMRVEPSGKDPDPTTITWLRAVGAEIASTRNEDSAKSGFDRILYFIFLSVERPVERPHAA